MSMFFGIFCLFLMSPLYAGGSFPDTETTDFEVLSASDTEVMAEEKNQVFWERVGEISSKIDEIKSEFLNRVEKERFSKDDIHPADVTVWNEKDFSPITEYEGIGSWTEYPCMKARLLSDTTGTHRRSWFTGGIDVVLDKECTFKNPEISVDETINTSFIRFFIPYHLPLSQLQNVFLGRVVFPFIAVPKTQGEKALLSATLSGSLCAKGQECVFVALPMRLSLSGETGDVTSVSAYVHRASSFVPQYVEAEELSGVLLNDKTIQVRVKTTSSRGNQSWLVKKSGEPIPFKITEAFAWEKNGYITFEFDQYISHTELTFVLKDDDVFFERTFKAEEGTPFIKPEIVSFNWFKLAFFFFFLSPWLVFVLLFSPKNDWEVRQKTTQVIAQCVLFVLLASCFLKLGIVVQNPFESDFWRWSMFGVFLCAWLFPIKKSAFSFALLSFCAPLMFLAEPIKLYPCSTLFVCMLVALLPFIYAKKNPHRMLKFWVGLRGINDYIKKLPLLGCAVWILLMQCAVFYNQTVDYPVASSSAVAQAVSEGKVVLVLGGDKTCVSCAWNKFYWKKTRIRYWYPLVVFKTDNKEPRFLYGPFNPKGIKLPDYMNGSEIDDAFQNVISLE